MLNHCIVIVLYLWIQYTFVCETLQVYNDCLDTIRSMINTSLCIKSGLIGLISILF
jgi:hypothetical protein